MDNPLQAIGEISTDSYCTLSVKLECWELIWGFCQERKALDMNLECREMEKQKEMNGDVWVWLSSFAFPRFDLFN